MAGQGRVDGERGRLAVANFPDHDDVWVLAHEGAEPIGEGESDTWIHLRLVDALHLVLDRVLDGRDIHVGRVQYVHHRVERGCLARTGGARDKDDAGRRLERFVGLLEPFAVEANRFKREAFAGLPQKPHHDLLPEEGWQYGDAEGYLVSLCLHLEAPVLWQTLLVELEDGEHLDARDDASGSGLRQGHRVVEDAVNAVAHKHFVLHRLDVDIGGASGDRVEQERVHDTHNREIFSHLLELLTRELSPLLDERELLGLARDDVTELILEGFLILQEGVLDALGIGQ